MGESVFRFLVNELNRLSHDEIEKKNENRVLLYREALFNFCQNDDSIEFLLKWMNNECKELEKVEISLANKWSIVCLIHASDKFEN